MMFMTTPTAVAPALARPLMGAQVKMLGLLLSRREAELRSLLDAEPVHDRAGGPDDHGLSARRRAELERVEAARWRLDDGIYGRCEQCAETIDFRRLVALPTTERCGPCDVAHARWHQWTRQQDLACCAEPCAETARA